MVHFQFIVQRVPCERDRHEVTFGAIREVVGGYRASVVAMQNLSISRSRHLAGTGASIVAIVSVGG